MLISRGGIPRSKGDFPECLTQAMLVGVMSVARLGVSITALSGIALIAHDACYVCVIACSITYLLTHAVRTPCST